MSRLLTVHAVSAGIPVTLEVTDVQADGLESGEVSCLFCCRLAKPSEPVARPLERSLQGICEPCSLLLADVWSSFRRVARG